MSLDDPRDDHYSVEDAMDDARRGVAGRDPRVGINIRSGITDPERAVREQQNALDDRVREQKHLQIEQERQAREAQRLQVEEEQRKVRAAAAAGVDTETDIETGRRSIARHDDGTPKFKAGPVGPPVEKISESRTTIVREDGTTTPTTNPLIADGGGAASTNTGKSEAKPVWQQTYRDDRGNELSAPIEEKTDSKTGEKFVEVPDAFGRPQRRVTGIDPKHAQRQQIEKETAGVDMRGNALAQTRLQFEPRWQPVKAEYLKAKQELDSIKPIDRNPEDGSWTRTTESGKVEYLEPIEVAKYHERLNKAKARFEQAERSYKPEEAKNADLERAERQVKLERLQLDARKIALEHDLPADDGGTALFLASAATGLPDPDREKASEITAETDGATPDYGLRPDGTPKGKGWLGELKLPDGGVATEYTMQSQAVTKDGKQIDFPTLVPSLTPDEVKLMTEDIIPNQKEIPETIIQKAIAHAKERIAAGQSVFVDDTAAPKVSERPDADAIRKAFPALQKVDGLSFTPMGNGLSKITRDGNLVGKIDTSGGSPVVVLEMGENDDLRTQVALGQTGGVPVYLFNNRKRRPEAEEAAWVAEVSKIATAPASNPMLAGGDSAAGVQPLSNNSFGTPGFDRQRAIKELGADPAGIIKKVKGGELSVQRGEAMLKDLYGMSLKADDPMQPATFHKWLEGAPAKTREDWVHGDPNTRDGIRNQFANDWYSKNRDLPGVTWAMQQAIRGKKVDRTMMDTATGMASSLGGTTLETGGSMGGLLAKYPTMGWLKVMTLWDPHAQAALDDMQEITGRANTNFGRNLKKNWDKWFTPEGETKLKELNTAADMLYAVISNRESTGGDNEAYKQRLREAMGNTTASAYALQALNLEEGWAVTPDDFDPNKDKALGSALLDFMETGDPASWQSFKRRLLLDKGSRQADDQMNDLTGGRSKLAAAFLAGGYATDAEAVVEIASDVLTFGVSKGVAAGAKMLDATIESAGALSRIERTKRAFSALGKVTDTLAKPAGKAGKLWNRTVDATKVATVNAVTEAGEEMVSGLGDPDATRQSVIEQGALGALGGLLLAPVIDLPTHLAHQSREAFNRKQQASKFATWYNKAMADTDGFTPLTPAEAEAAVSTLDPEQHQALLDAHQAAVEEVKAAAEEVANSSAPERGTPSDNGTAAEIGKAWKENANSRLSRAIAAASETGDALIGHLATVVEAAKSTKDMDAPTKARTLGLMKVATNRPELLTGSERTAITGLTTREGMPYFADVKGKTVFTAEGRAELLQDQPVIGALVQTDESRALVESAAAPTQKANEQNPQGQPAGKGQPPAPVQVPAVPTGTNGAAQPVATGSGAPVNGQAQTKTQAPVAAPSNNGQATAPAPAVKKSAARPVYRVEKRGGKSAVVADDLPEPVWQGKDEEAEAALKSAQDKADSPLAVANRAKRRLEERYPALKGKVRIDDQTERGDGGVHTSAEGVTFTLRDLERDLSLYEPESRDSRVDATLDEEVVHHAQFAAVAKSGKTVEDYYGSLWNDFTPEQQQAGADVYQGNWSKLEDWQKAGELVRMLIQAKRSGRVTEVTKAFSKSVPQRMLELLASALEYLRGLGARVSPRIKATIEAVEAILDEHAGTAGNRTKADAAAANSAVQGEATIEGTDAKLTTPNNERTIDVKQTVVDLDQLVGSSDPRFPSTAFQPRDRSSASSAAQLDEMARNLATNPEQFRRYLEGSTTDTGRPLVAPLMENGKQVTDDTGRPLYYVLSGNGRKNAITEADRRGTAGKFFDSIREETGSTLEKPVPISIYQPKDGADAIQIAELSNRDAGLSVSNTEQAIRDARAVEPILNLWQPDESGNASAASNRDFVRAFVQATGDTGILANDGTLTEEGALRIDRALLATLLGPRNQPVLEQLFNRDLGLRNAIAGIASEAGNLLRIAVDKPAYDLSGVLADALRQAVAARAAIESGTATTAADYFDQGDLFADNSDTPAKQLARALAETRSKKSVREILGTYRQAADQIDTTTDDMFGGVATRDDLIARALDARPFDRIVQEIAAEFGAQSLIARKLEKGIAAVKKLSPADRRSLAAAVGYEVERLREGIPSAEEYQATFEPGQLEPRAAFLQRWLDSHTADSINWEAMGKARAAALSASATERFHTILDRYEDAPPVAQESEEQVFTRLRENFGEDALKQAIDGFNQRHAAHGPHKPAFDKAISEIADAHDGKAKLASLKGRKRSVEKILMDYAGDVSQIKDILRASIVADDLADIDAIAEDIHRRFKVVKFKNRFSPPLPSGYSDMLIVVEAAPGIFAEVQVHIPEMIQAKAKAHALYERLRSIENDSTRAAEVAELNKQMLEIYEAAALAAIERSTKASNASGVSGSPSMSAFISVFADKGRALPPNAPTGLPSGGIATGMSSTSTNLVPGGKSEARVTPDSPISKDNGQTLSSSATLDLFGEELFGPVAATKRKAIARAKADPAARAGIAKTLAGLERVESPDLFASAVAKNLESAPAQRIRKRRDDSPGQLGLAFDSDVSPGGDSGGAGRTRASGQAGDVSDGGIPTGGTDGGSPRIDSSPDVQSELPAGGSRSGSADGNPAGGGQGSDAGGSGGSEQDRRPRSEQAGQRRRLTVERPAEGSPERNHEIGAADVLAEGGSVTRLRNNLSALDLLRTLETENRNATTEEKRALAKYVGWGGIPQVFDELTYNKLKELPQRRQTAAYYRERPQYAEYAAEQDNEIRRLENWEKQWKASYDQLRDALTPEEWSSARDSTINAHYTSPTVINGMWDGVRRLGFKGGNVTEPAGGIGHFFGLMPRDIADASRLFGVELDSVSGRIFQKLYPEAEIEINGFQETTIPNNSQDLVISNVPFANINISDPVLSAQGAPAFNLHNYFFERALRIARPGGLVAFITTAHTMDSNIAQRKWLASRSDFAGAIRLPNDAFKGNAATDVVTDIIFLRKPDGSPAPWAGAWTSVQPVQVDGGTLNVNEWFVDHPELILGRLAGDGTMYAKDAFEMTIHGTGPLGPQLANAIESLPQNVIAESTSDTVSRARIDNRAAKLGSFVADENGNLSIHGSDDKVAEKDRGKVRSFVKVRDALNNLYRLESSPDGTDAQIAAARRELNAAYDAHTRLFKDFHQPRTKDLLQTDPDYFRVAGLEVPVKGTKTFTKADVFTRRVLTPRVEPTSAQSIEEGIVASLRWRGRLDPAYVGSLLGVTLDEAESQILATGDAFRDPATGRIETKALYLAGNVRTKLRTARLAAASDAAYQANVSALEAVMPSDVPWADIDVQMGSTWVPPEVYSRFITDRLGLPRDTKAIYHPGVGEMIPDRWEVQVTAKYGTNSADLQWGTQRRSAADTAESALNQTSPIVRDQVADGNGGTKSIANADETQKARAAVERVQQAFLSWLADTPEVQDTLHTVYNEVCNSHVVPQFDGSHLQLPWVAEGFDLYPDKKHVVWRALQDGNMLVAHGVGGGKTIIGTAVALEMKRLGMATKPVIVVHNATLEQFAATIAQMAPTARVLVARKEDLAGPKRKEFMGRVRSGDWDAVVMAHSTFDLIPDDPKWEKKALSDLESELIQGIQDAGGNADEEVRSIKDPSVKEMVKQLKRLRERMSKLQDRRADDTLTFQEIGFDALILDEAHKYKKTPFVTKQSTIAGIDTGFSKRGAALLLRTRFIQAKNNGRGVFLMTGTPVTNTLGESWNMVRMVKPELLDEFRVQSFDRFVSTFGKIKSSGELRANGQYKAVSRLSEVSNLPEWNRFWQLAADVKMGDDMQVKGRPKIKGGAPALVTVDRTPGVDKFVDYIQQVIADFDAMTGKEKRENSHIPLLTYNAARMAAIDMRLVNPSHPDEAGSKVNEALENVMRLYRDTTPQRGTQVIFADSYRPLRTTKLDMSAADFEAATEDETERDDFNLYHDIREKLVARGVPREDIAIITEAKNDKARAAMAAAVNEGKIRIIMGSTETLGTGVNMQGKMIAAHHLDVPWTPAGLEQRDGRVYRQGNMWAELNRDIELLRYGMKDTLDAALWQKLETKERFIKQAISGKTNARSVEDDTGLINLAEQKAILSGPDGMLKFELDEKVRNLGNDFRAFRNRQHDLRRAVQTAERTITWGDGALPRAEASAAVVEPLRADDPTAITLSIDGGEALTGEPARKALDEVMKDRQKRAGQSLRPAETDAVTKPVPLTVNGVPMELVVANVTENTAGAANPDTRWNLSWTLSLPGHSDFAQVFRSQRHPGGIISEIQRGTDYVAARPVAIRNEIAAARAQVDVARQELVKPFDKQAELADAMLQQGALYQRMGLGLPFDDTEYFNAIGPDWKERVIPAKVAADAVEQAADQTATDPSDAQKEAGNYRKGKVTLHGMPISIENPRGSERSGTDKGGKPWSVTMAHHYGYFLGTEGKDGDHVDTFIGPDVDSTRAYIVNQVNDGRFDEHKVMLGFSNREAAEAGYLASYSPGWKGLGSIVETDVAVLKKWLSSDKTGAPAKASDFPAMSVSSAISDAEYLSAVERGDMESAQRMVDEAAKAAGYTIKGYHGTLNGGFDSFDLDIVADDAEPGVAWFSDTREAAEGFIKKYRLGKPRKVNEDNALYNTRTKTRIERGNTPEIIEAWIRPGKTFDQSNLTESDIEWLTSRRIMGMPITREEVARYAEAPHGSLLKMYFDEYFQNRETAYDTFRFKFALGTESAGHEIGVTNTNDAKSASAVTRDSAGKIIPLSLRFNKSNSSILHSSATLPDITTEVLASMSPLYRNVFNATMKGEPVETIAKRFSITERAVKNITDQVRSRIRTLTNAASDEGLKPAMKDGKFNGGRPDLALSTNPVVAAVDQIREQEHVPDVRGHAEVNTEAAAMLDKDYAGTFDTLLAKARDLQPFTDTEVAAAKILISRETLAGKTQTQEERRKIAKLIHGYRDIGTETARSLAMRRDPHKTPAERHAQYIAEALFTPDPETRARMRKHPGQQDSILDSWLTRAEGIKQALKTAGYDIDATLAAFDAATKARKQAEQVAPRATAAIEEEIRRLDPTSRAVVEAVRSGSNWTAAAMASGLDIADAKARYAKFREKVTDVMRGAARKYLTAALSASPTATESSILAELGLPEVDDIAESSTEPSVNAKKRKAAKQKPKRPVGKPDMSVDDYANRPLDTTRTFPPQPMGDFDGKRIDPQGEFDPANPDPIGKQLEPWKHADPISGGLFDLNDPLAMKKVMDEFALARGKWFDALLEFWRMSILSGPQTHIVNISSNVLHGIYDLLPRRAVEAGINGMLGIVGQGAPESATFGEFAPMARQLYAAAARAGRNALRSWQLQDRVFEAQALALSQQLDFTGVKADYIPPALGGKLGTIMRALSFRAMTAADEMMKSFLGQLEAAAQAHRIAKSEKLTGKEYEARLAELMEPGSIAWVRAVDQAKRVTFQSELAPDNPQVLHRLDQIADALKKARRARYGGKLLTFFLPFIDTPLNIFKLAVEMSPLGAAVALFDAAQALKVKLIRGELKKEEADAAAAELYNRARAVRDLTNQVIAWGALFALQGMTEADDDDKDDIGLPQITGSVSYTDTRRGERDVMFRTMPPQSIRIGKMIFSYKRFEPFATALSGAVDAIRAVRSSGGVNDEALSLYMGGLKDGLKDKTFLSGLSDLINAFENPQRFFPNVAGNIATGFVPNLIRQPIRETDEFVRDDKARPGEGFFEAIAKKVGGTVVPSLLPVRIDVWGNPVKRHNGPASDSLLRIIDPTDANLGAKPDVVDRYILNWNLAATDPKDRLAIEPIGNSVASRKGRIVLTPAQQETANIRAGKRARTALGDTWDWRNPTPQGIERIRQAVRDAQDSERERIRAVMKPEPAKK